MMATQVKVEAALLPPLVGPSFLVSQVGAIAALGFGARLAPLGLKPHHAGILRILGRNPGVSQQELSEVLGVFASRLVLLVDELEKHQLLERRANRSDRRSHRLHLTARGRKMLAAIGAVTLGLEEQLFAALTQKERTLLSALLTRVVAEQGLQPGVHSAYRELNRRPWKSK
jgi:DNA-binding MarR family transcriptional regulator